MSEASVTALPRENFAMFLAGALQDLRQSLGEVLISAEHIADTVLVAREDYATLALLQHEARRANCDLTHLLGLYELERGAPLIVPDVVDCADLVAELVATNMPLLASRGIMLDVAECTAIEGYFDRALVLGVLNAALNDTFRHAKSRVTLDCSVHEGYTVFTVEDDGAGFPQDIVDSGLSTVGDGAWEGSLGLWLHFARRVAALHCHRERCGRVELSNRPGGCFRIHLP